jgi:hypothetical protein
MSRKAGSFTEAEMAAAQWRRQRRQKEDAAAGYDGNSSNVRRSTEREQSRERNDNPRRAERDRYNSSSGDRRGSSSWRGSSGSSGGSWGAGEDHPRGHYTSRRSADTTATVQSDSRRSDFRHVADEERSGNRNRTSTSNKQREQDVDEFGRVVRDDMPRVVSNPPDRVRSWSRSRSRSRSPLRRLADRGMWRHDLFSRDESSSPPRQSSPHRTVMAERDADRYRPSSTTWISKAGGVAIMKRKQQQPQQHDQQY